jgi:hypothetical protein
MPCAVTTAQIRMSPQCQNSDAKGSFSCAIFDFGVVVGKLKVTWPQKSGLLSILWSTALVNDPRVYTTKLLRLKLLRYNELERYFQANLV